METHYKVLGVSSDAAPDEIRAAYRSLAKQYHPDINHDPDAGERFIAIQQAYETLIDPDARARYDLALRGGATAGPHDAYQWYRSDGQTVWTRGFSWNGPAPASRIGRLGVLLFLFFGGILIVFMLILSLLVRAVFGGKRQQDS
ncbi:J domain-containing protein [Methanoculleus sp. MH98A]|uniref:J domain-containing protein n=1 Tax=Methanoculleus sp. MH98A TaxID=1495314 RepID=UPI00049FD142|nr:J domain-containing protein [Methanoculleus sp. MH98A]KDE56208.1 molecular chaperone DnaJ [Methanoculleus sp. MH98A]